MNMQSQEHGYNEHFEKMTGNALAAHLAYMRTLEQNLNP
jgi:hypothetical protein